MPIGYDLTSSGWLFSQRVATGEFHEALGVPDDAPRIRIDVAVARLIDANPGMAREISRVGNVLTHRRHRAVYDATRALRVAADAVVVACAGEEPAGMLGEKGSTWRQACRLTKLDLEHIDAAAGPLGAGSLPPAATDWVVVRYLEAVLPEVAHPDEPEGVVKLRSLLAALRCGRRAREIAEIDRLLPQFHHMQRLGLDCRWQDIPNRARTADSGIGSVPWSQPPSGPADRQNVGELTGWLVLVAILGGIFLLSSGRTSPKNRHGNPVPNFTEDITRILEEQRRQSQRVIADSYTEELRRKMGIFTLPPPGTPSDWVRGSDIVPAVTRRRWMEELRGAAAGPVPLGAGPWAKLMRNDLGDVLRSLGTPEDDAGSPTPSAPRPGGEEGDPRPAADGQAASNQTDAEQTPRESD